MVASFLSAVPSAGLHWLFRMMQITMAMAVAYLVYLVVRRGWLFVRDVHLLYSLASGSTYLSVAKNKRLRVFIVPREHLDEVAMSDLFNLHKDIVQGETVTMETTRQLVHQSDLVFFYRDCFDGTLRGYMLASQKDGEKEGKRYCVMHLIAGLFRKEYTGGPLLYATGLYYCLKQLVLHPRTPLFVLTNVVSFMSYSFCATNFKRCYPRYDYKEIPPYEKSLIDEYGRSLEGPTVRYNAETCVLEMEMVSLKQYVAPIDKRIQQNPHTQFFVERNPHWHKGHQMVVLTQVTWGAIFTIAWRMLKKATQRSAQGGRNRRVKYESRRSISNFVSEREYMRQHDGTSELSDPFKTETEEGVSSSSGLLLPVPEGEQVDESGKNSNTGHLPPKKSKFVKTHSLMLGVDRIDEYSQMDIQTP